VAVAPSSDIILDVVRAADPAQVEAARARLARPAGGGPVEAFSAAGPTVSGRGVDPTPEAFVKFEAMVLQSFIEAMLPKDSESVYGEGLAGDMWRSMTAEHIAGAMSAAGGIGVADRILRDYYMQGEEKRPLAGVRSPAESQDAEARSLQSTALIQEIQRKIAQSLSADVAAARPRSL
jgi:Rod binding domain-containing protein